MGIVDNRKKLNKELRRSKNIFIMAHRDLDLDALGSSIGMYTILQKRKKNCYIIIDDRVHELGVEKVLKELEGCIKIIKSEEIKKYMSARESRNILIILDTNKKELVQSQKALNIFNRKLVIDHHELGTSTIEDAVMIHDEESSSCCQMITELIEYFDVDLEPYYATVLLAGIVLDTNNFTLKTSSDTYYSAYYLASLGASAKKVQYLLKQDILEYKERQKLLSAIQILNERIAFTKATPYTIYRREDLAKVADTLLFFNNIEASFVIGKINKTTIGISARSLGGYDIGRIMARLGGGGDNYNGAAKFENTTISNVEKLLKQELEKEGE